MRDHSCTKATAQADHNAGWLEEEGEKPEWSIEGKDARPIRRLTSADLDAAAGELPVPSAMRLLARRRDLQRRIRSATACYLDLGDFVAKTSAEGGYLIPGLRRVP